LRLIPTVGLNTCKILKGAKPAELPVLQSAKGTRLDDSCIISGNIRNSLN